MITRALAAPVALFVAAAAFVAATVPFHATDALIYGRWSRLIGLEGDLHFPGIGSGYLHRPLVYVVQGELWNVFGFHEWIGRLWSLAFALLLLVAVWRVAGRDRAGALTAALAAALLVATPDFVSLAAAGLTDVAVGAMVGVTGVVALSDRGGAAGGRAALWRAAAIVVLAALAGLAKPSAFFGLLGIGLALLVGTGRRDRVVRRGIPLVAGVLLALAWDAAQAHRMGQSLAKFVGGADTTEASNGVLDYYHVLGAQSRASFVAGMEWLGPYLVVPLLFGLAYALARAVGVAHRRAATVAAPVAIVLSWLLPTLAHDVLGPWTTERPTALLGSAILVVPLLLSRECPEEEAPSRVHLARMLLWAAPPTLAWIASAPFQTRYLSPAWVPLYALVAAALATAVRAGGRRHWAIGWAAVLAVIGLATFDLRNLDGLGNRPDGSNNAVRTIRSLGVSGWFHPDRARAAADPVLAALHDAVGAALERRGGRLVSLDGRLGFYWPRNAVRAEPQRCEQLRGYSLLVVTQSRTGLDRAHERRLSKSDLAQATGGHAADPAFWKRCRAPATRLLDAVPGQFAVFAVDRAP